MTRAFERLWFEEPRWAMPVRAVLAPAAGLYRGVIATRNALYDRGIATVIEPPIPVISVGNLTVGGTGKTPFAAWMVRELSNRGAAPAIVMRGYGADEPAVHERLNPGVPVIVDADRARGVAAAARARCDVAVLDDGFQHRRAGRTVDLVLVSADRWQPRQRLLPAGPWRESLAALRRAHGVIVTARVATSGAAGDLCRRLAGLTRERLGAVARLSLAELHDASTGARRSLDQLRGARVLLVAGVGDPSALAAQVRAAGAEVRVSVFPDHHVYETLDASVLASEAGRHDAVICTLKDAVKLGPLWPRGGEPLWYVSQRVDLEEGAAGVSALVDRVIAARH